uniref:Uncharacterized protein n=2 Tax=Oryza TaxID=4527 RepID=Q10L45_ORYSJ|nr:hypothetical protein LOC_Os03g24470 [Oryza sativa Japonica Group]
MGLSQVKVEANPMNNRRFSLTLKKEEDLSPLGKYATLVDSNTNEEPRTSLLDGTRQSNL